MYALAIGVLSKWRVWRERMIVLRTRTARPGRVLTAPSPFNYY